MLPAGWWRLAGRGLGLNKLRLLLLLLLPFSSDFSFSFSLSVSCIFTDKEIPSLSPSFIYPFLYFFAVCHPTFYIKKTYLKISLYFIRRRRRWRGKNKMESSWCAAVTTRPRARSSRRIGMRGAPKKYFAFLFDSVCVYVCENSRRRVITGKIIF